MNNPNFLTGMDNAPRTPSPNGLDRHHLGFLNLVAYVFLRHGRQEKDEIAAGQPRSIEQLSDGWPRPWIFSRVLALLLAAFGLLYACMQVSEIAGSLLPGVVALGSLIVPLTLLFFFFECNTFRNITLLSTLRCLLLGSCLSVAIVFCLTYGLKLCESLHIAVPAWMGLDFATWRPYGSMECYADSFMVAYALFEELGKGLVIFLFLRRYREQCFILPSMLIGAAVGAGFAVFESAGNTLAAMQSHLHFLSLLTNQLMAPVCHVAWGALMGGGIAMLSRRGLQARILFKPWFWLLFLGVTASHFLWNYLQCGPLSWLLTLSVCIWFAVLCMIWAGVRQVRRFIALGHIPLQM